MAVVWVVKPKHFPDSPEEVKQLASEICQEMNLTEVNSFQHAFSPYGVTHVSVLAQSHLAIHTWPELECLRIDLVTCEPFADALFMKAIDNKTTPENIEYVQSCK